MPPKNNGKDDKSKYVIDILYDVGLVDFLVVEPLQKLSSQEDRVRHQQHHEQLS